jgi:hypothetical protein
MKEIRVSLELRALSERAEDLWNGFIEQDSVRELLKPSQPRLSALAIKVPSQAELMRVIGRYFDHGDQFHGAPVGERSIVTICKAEPFGSAKMRQIKLLQRRLGSADALGFDHVDVQVRAGTNLSELAAALVLLGAGAVVQTNGMHSWVSVRFGGHEIKLVDHPVWQVCCAEATDMLKTLAN